MSHSPNNKRPIGAVPQQQQQRQLEGKKSRLNYPRLTRPQILNSSSSRSRANQTDNTNSGRQLISGPKGSESLNTIVINKEKHGNSNLNVINSSAFVIAIDNNKSEIAMEKSADTKKAIELDNSSDTVVAQRKADSSVVKSVGKSLISDSENASNSGYIDSSIKKKKCKFRTHKPIPLPVLASEIKVEKDENTVALTCNLNIKKEHKDSLNESSIPTASATKSGSQGIHNSVNGVKNSFNNKPIRLKRNNKLHLSGHDAPFAKTKPSSQEHSSSSFTLTEMEKSVSTTTLNSPNKQLPHESPNSVRKNKKLIRPVLSQAKDLTNSKIPANSKAKAEQKFSSPSIPLDSATVTTIEKSSETQDLSCVVSDSHAVHIPNDSLQSSSLITNESCVPENEVQNLLSCPNDLENSINPAAENVTVGSSLSMDFPSVPDPQGIRDNSSAMSDSSNALSSGNCHPSSITTAYVVPEVFLDMIYNDLSKVVTLKLDSVHPQLTVPNLIKLLGFCGKVLSWRNLPGDRSVSSKNITLFCCNY